MKALRGILATLRQKDWMEKERKRRERSSESKASESYFDSLIPALSFAWQLQLFTHFHPWHKQSISAITSARGASISMLHTVWEKCNAGLLPALEVPHRHSKEQREKGYRKAEHLSDARTHVWSTGSGFAQWQYHSQRGLSKVRLMIIEAWGQILGSDIRVGWWGQRWGEEQRRGDKMQLVTETDFFF